MPLTQAARVEAVRASILSSFRDVEYPGDEGLVSSPDDHESGELADGLRGKDWRQLSRATVVKFKDALPLLSSRGFHYFLPGYLLCCADAVDDLDVAPENVMSALTPRRSKRNGAAWSGVERTEAFTSAQVQSIVLYLELAKEREEAEGAAADPRRGVDRTLSWWRERATKGGSG